MTAAFDGQKQEDDLFWKEIGAPAAVNSAGDHVTIGAQKKITVEYPVENLYNIIILWEISTLSH